MNIKKGALAVGLIGGALVGVVALSPVGYGQEKEREFYESGKLKSEWFYKKGVLDGPYKAYYENGKIKTEASYKNGELEGPVKEYDEKGRLKR